MCFLCIYDIKFKNLANIGMINFTVSGKNMDLYDLNNKLKVARERGFIFIHIKRLAIKIQSHQRYIKVSYYLKSQTPTCPRHFLKVISQNRDYVDNFCNDSINPVHFACQKWIKKCMYIYNFTFVSNST